MANRTRSGNGNQKRDQKRDQKGKILITVWVDLRTSDLLTTTKAVTGQSKSKLAEVALLLQLPAFMLTNADGSLEPSPLFAKYFGHRVDLLPAADRENAA